MPMPYSCATSGYGSVWSPFPSGQRFGSGKFSFTFAGLSLDLSFSSENTVV